MSEWIKLHRKSLDSRVFSDDFLWRLLSWCMLKANWKRGWYSCREIPPGSFVTGELRASGELGVSGSKWRRGIKRLSDFGCIKVEATNKFTVITVCNWGNYQGSDDFEHPSDEPPDEPSDEQATAIEEGKKGRKKEKSARFVKPTLLEIQGYINSKGYKISAQDFLDYHETRGWKLKGNVPMKCWKAAVRTWESRRNNGFEANGSAPKRKPFERERVQK